MSPKISDRQDFPLEKVKSNDAFVIYTSWIWSQGTEVMKVWVSLGDCQIKQKKDQEMIIQP